MSCKDQTDSSRIQGCCRGHYKDGNTACRNKGKDEFGGYCGIHKSQNKSTVELPNGEVVASPVPVKLADMTKPDNCITGNRKCPQETPYCSSVTGNCRKVASTFKYVLQYNGNNIVGTKDQIEALEKLLPTARIIELSKVKGPPRKKVIKQNIVDQVFEGALPSPSNPVNRYPINPRITLRPDQLEHVDKLNSILDNNMVVIDTSPTGTGKTYTTCAIAQSRGLKIMVVTLATIQHNWVEVTTRFGLMAESIIGYESLVGTNFSEPNSKMLRRRLYDKVPPIPVYDDSGVLIKTIKNNTKHEIVFNTTEAFKTMVDNGVLIVFDEFNKLKNADTALFQAAKTMIRGLTGKSRVILISATPGEKLNNVYTIIRLLGITDEEKLYGNLPKWQLENIKKQGLEDTYQGYNNILDWCAKQASTKSEKEFVKSLPDHIDSKNQTDIISKIFSTFIKYKLGSSMSMPKITDLNGNIITLNDKSSTNLANCYYNVLNEDDKRILSDSVSKLTENLNTSNGLASITKALGMIEKAKINIICRAAAETLTKVPNSKVIIFVNRLDSFGNISEGKDGLVKCLYKAKVGMMSGDTPLKARNDLIAKFQEPNDKMRVFISTIDTGGVGLSLDDQDGHWPRYLYIIPSYQFPKIYQAIGRVLRSNTKSQPIVRIVYGKTDESNKNTDNEFGESASKHGSLESQLLTNLYEKAQIFKLITSTLIEDMPFPPPGEIPNIIEEDFNYIQENNLVYDPNENNGYIPGFVPISQPMANTIHSVKDLEIQYPVIVPTPIKIDIPLTIQIPLTSVNPEVNKFTVVKKTVNRNTELIKIMYNNEPITWDNFLNNNTDDFLLFFNKIFKDSAFNFFYFETPQIILQNNVEFVLINASILAGNNGDYTPFKEYFEEQSYPKSVVFNNISGDAELIVPVPPSNTSGVWKVAASLGVYTRQASNESIIDFWRTSFNQINVALGEYDPYVSTSGEGVKYLHLRISHTPKYYKYKPYIT